MKQLVMLEKGDEVMVYVDMWTPAIVTETPDIHATHVWVKLAAEEPTEQGNFMAPQEVPVRDICAFRGCYLVERRYGGPEEGGWWFDWHTHLFSMPVKLLLGVSEAQLRTFMHEQLDLNEYDNNSVLGDGEVSFMWEEYPAEHESTERPHYE